MRFKVCIEATLLAIGLISFFSFANAYAHETSNSSCEVNQHIDITNWNRYLSVDVQIGNFHEPLVVIFDTGSTDAVASDANLHSFLENHNTKLRTLRTFEGNVTGRVTEPVEIFTQGCLLGETPLTLLDSEHFIFNKLERSAESAVLIIGPQSLPRYDFEIDFLKSKLRLMQARNLTTSVNGRRGYFANAEMDGQVYECVLDTGFVNTSGLFVRPESELAQKLVSSDRKRRSGSVKIADKDIEVWQMLVKNVRIGGLDGPALMQVGKVRADNDILSSPACIIGTDALAKTVVTLRAGSSEVQLDGKLNSGRYNRTGISSVTRTGVDLLRINNVENESPADLLGLRAGDFIFKIDEKNIDELDSSEYIINVFSQPPGQKISLGVMRDNEREFIQLVLEETL